MTHGKIQSVSQQKQSTTLKMKSATQQIQSAIWQILQEKYHVFLNEKYSFCRIPALKITNFFFVTNVRQGGANTRQGGLSSGRILALATVLCSDQLFSFLFMQTEIQLFPRIFGKVWRDSSAGKKHWNKLENSNTPYNYTKRKRMTNK